MTPDEMIAVIAGYRDGKKVQARRRITPNLGWLDAETPCWDFNLCDYRLAPEPAPEPVCAACGHPVSEHGIVSFCWHNITGDDPCSCARCQRECVLPASKPAPVPPGDLTWEEARDLRNKGVVIQEDIDGCWIDVRICAGDDLIKDRAYRRKPALRMVPLGPEDVKPGDVFRFIKCSDKSSWSAPFQVDKEGVSFTWTTCTRLQRWAVLQDEYEISRDGGATWQRAEKEVRP